jgi:hypothetical protein
VWLFGVYLGVPTDTALRTATAGTAAGFALVVLALPLLPVLITAVSAVVGGADWPVGKIPVLLAACLQLVVAGLLLLAVVAFPWPDRWPNSVVLLGAVGIAAVGGAGLGSEAFALFILLARTGEVAGWRMAGQAVEDHKGFVRMCLRSNGDLELYPLVVDRICRDWDLELLPGGTVRPVPADGAIAVRLAEAPITISRKGFSRVATADLSTSV